MSNVIDLTGYRYAKRVRNQDTHTYDALMYTLGKEAQWISTKDRLPEIDKHVLITHRTSEDHGNLSVMQAFRINDCEYVIDVYSDGTCVLADYVDYWMPLPSPPRKDNP